MIDALLVPALACINRFRGGGLYADRLPGHPRLYASAAVALVALPFAGTINAVALGVAFLCWAMLPWGGWYDLDRMNWRLTNSAFERAIDHLPGDHVRFTVRNLIGLLPAAILLDPLFLAIAPLQTAAYEIGWRATPRVPTVTGEWLTGAVWGAFAWWLL